MLSPAALERLSTLPLVVGTVDGVLGSELEVTLLPSSTSLWSPAQCEPAAGTVNGMVRILRRREKKKF